MKLVSLLFLASGLLTVCYCTGPAATESALQATNQSGLGKKGDPCKTGHDCEYDGTVPLDCYDDVCKKPKNWVGYAPNTRCHSHEKNLTWGFCGDRSGICSQLKDGSPCCIYGGSECLYSEGGKYDCHCSPSCRYQCSKAAPYCVRQGLMTGDQTGLGRCQKEKPAVLDKYCEKGCCSAWGEGDNAFQCPKP